METPVNALAAQAKIRPRVWLDVGKMDWLLRPNRKMRRHLQTNKFDVRYREYFAYHNWVAWRNTLPDALTWAFGKDKGR
jgi:enterochelin esterase family protein